MSTSYTRLESIFSRLSRFEHLGAIAYWDAQAMMPSGGRDARSAALAELDVFCHESLTAEHVAHALQAATQEDLGPDQAANLREMQRAHDQARVLPARLVQAQSLAAARCEYAWRNQRPANDWSGFVENLRPVVALAREEASIRSQAFGSSRYDALLDKFEPGLSTDELDRVFDNVRQWLPDLLQQVLDFQADEQQSGRAITPLAGPFDIDQQKALARSVMRRLGFDFEHGRLDVSAHPFSGGVPEDTRLTTRYNPDECLTAIMSTIHETGHAALRAEPAAGVA